MWWMLAVAGIGVGATFGWLWWRTLRYVALGDSIAFGIGSLTLFGYPPRLARALARRLRRRVALRNHAIFGLTSAQILGLVEADERVRNALRSAGLITVNAGGNDLLRCNYQESCLPGALAQFRSNWEGILRAIRLLNPRAPLFVLTLYNPYPLGDVRRPPVAAGIEALNATILDQSLLDRYGVTGVAALGPLFAGHECDWTWFCAIGDPHPTDSGHAAIAAELSELTRLVWPAVGTHKNAAQRRKLSP
jgi:lysophospholipase L1-like esterase